MPDPAAIRERLPLVLNSLKWFCCGNKGIEIINAIGESQWSLMAICLNCKNILIIDKHGVFKSDHHGR